MQASCRRPRDRCERVIELPADDRRALQTPWPARCDAAEQDYARALLGGVVYHDVKLAVGTQRGQLNWLAVGVAEATRPGLGDRQESPWYVNA